jgi:hypothetical protein
LLTDFMTDLALTDFALTDFAPDWRKQLADNQSEVESLTERNSKKAVPIHGRPARADLRAG